MFKRVSLVLSTLLCAVALTGPVVFAPAAHAADAAAKAARKAEKKKDQHRGKVTAADATSITIQHKKEAAQTFTISDATKITVEKNQGAKATDITPGMHALVTSTDGKAATAIKASAEKLKK